MHCQDWSTRRQGVSIRRTTRPLPRQDGSPPAIQTYRIFQFGVNLGVIFDAASFRVADGNSSPQIIHKSSCVSLRTYQEILLLWKHSAPGATSTGRPQR